MSMLTVRLNKLVEGWKRLLKLITKLVGKWQSYIIGGGAILLFFVLLLLRLDIPQRLFRGEEKQTPVMIIAANGETWLTITQNGQKISYVFRRLAQTEKGFKFSETFFMRINTMGIVQPINVQTSADLKAGGEISDFQFALRSNLLSLPRRVNLKTAKFLYA